MNSTDNWQTPIWLMKIFSEFYDPCPNNFTEDYLNMDVANKNHIFINPPYSDPKPFILKAIKDHKEYPNTTIILLLKNDSSTQWYRALFDAGAHFLMFQERLHYLYEGTDRGGANFPSILAILSD